MFDPQASRVSEALVSHLLRFCEDHPSPRTTGVWILVRQLGLAGGEIPFASSSPDESFRDFERDSFALLGLPRPCDHDDHFRFVCDRYATEFLKKVTWLPMPDKRRANALAKFQQAETTCSLANNRFRNEPEPSWFGRVRKTIARVLGPLDSGVLDTIVDLMRHGPGSSVGIKGDGLTASDKYRYPVTMTANLLPYAESIMGPLWASRYRPLIVRGSTWSSVRKNAETDRGICTEPVLNMFGQLGIGEYLAKRLKRFGVDLRDQRWNQALAEKAEMWRLATLDLASASDCTAYESVRSLFPPKWFALLALFRSPEMKIDGSWVALEKWSTMGNGYTFPLETLIFYAVVSAMVPRKDMCVTAVYGDDMIVPQANVAAVVEALEYLGFQVNGKKSCLAGNFFESCGTDFLRGKQCRPFFAPSEPGPIPKSVQTANGFRLWLMSVFGYCPSEFRDEWKTLVKQTPSDWKKTHVPASWGDVGIIRSSPLAKWRVSDPEKEGHGWSGFLAKSVMFVPTDDSHADYCDFPVMVAGVRRIGLGASTDTSVPSSRIRGLKQKLPEHVVTLPDPSGVATRGLEPRKGLYGRPVSRFAFTCEWTHGLAWV